MCLSKPVILTFIKYCYCSEKKEEEEVNTGAVKGELSHSEMIWCSCFFSFPFFFLNESTAWFPQLLDPAGRGCSQQVEVVERHVISPRWFNAAPPFCRTGAVTFVFVMARHATHSSGLPAMASLSSACPETGHVWAWLHHRYTQRATHRHSDGFIY